MTSCLVSMDKMPGVRPLGIGDIHPRLWAKLVIKDCGSQTNCGISKLHLGLEAGIEGALHSIHNKNISIALSFPEPNILTSTTTIANKENALKIMVQ